MSEQIQFIRRADTDQYGTEGHRSRAYRRPMRARNGLSWHDYGYRGTGQSMSHREAQWWLTETVSEVKVCPICDD